MKVYTSIYHYLYELGILRESKERVNMKAKVVPVSAIGSAADPIVTRKPTNIVRNYMWELTTHEQGFIEGTMATDDPDYLYFLGRENSHELTTVTRRYLTKGGMFAAIAGVRGADTNKVYQIVVTLDGERLEV